MFFRLNWLDGGFTFIDIGEVNFGAIKIKSIFRLNWQREIFVELSYQIMSYKSKSRMRKLSLDQ